MSVNDNEVEMIDLIGIICRFVRSCLKEGLVTKQQMKDNSVDYLSLLAFEDGDMECYLNLLAIVGSHISE